MVEVIIMLESVKNVKILTIIKYKHLSCKMFLHLYLPIKGLVQQTYSGISKLSSQCLFIISII